MRRGEIWTVRGSSGWIEKSRPALIVQHGGFERHDSTVTCLFTTYDSNGDAERVHIEPSEQNGLRHACYVMTDKLVSVRHDEFGVRVGELEERYLSEVSERPRTLLGL